MKLLPDTLNALIGKVFNRSSKATQDRLASKGGLGHQTDVDLDYTTAYTTYDVSDLESLYKAYDAMDRRSLDVSEFLDKVSEEATLINKERGATIWVESKTPLIEEKANKMLKRLQVDKKATPICRNIGKYGRWVVKPLYVELSQGGKTSVRLSHLDDNVREWNKLMSIENKPYYLRVKGWYDQFNQWLGFVYNDVEYPHWAFLEFKIGEGYIGKSLLEDTYDHWQSLDLVEQQLKLFRLAKSPQTTIYKVPTGSADPVETINTVKYYKRFVESQLKKVKTGSHKDALVFTPVSSIFWPENKYGSGSVDVQSNNAEINNISDIDYLRNKFMRKLGLPPDEQLDNSRNLSAVNVTLLRKVQRVQQAFVEQIDRLVQIELSLLGIKTDEDSYQIKMSSPSDIEETLRLEKVQLAVDIFNQLVTVGQSVVAQEDASKWNSFLVNKQLTPYFGDMIKDYKEFIKKKSNYIVAVIGDPAMMDPNAQQAYGEEPVAQDDPATDGGDPNSPPVERFVNGRRITESKGVVTYYPEKVTSSGNYINLAHF